MTADRGRTGRLGRLGELGLLAAHLGGRRHQDGAGDGGDRLRRPRARGPGAHHPAGAAAGAARATETGAGAARAQRTDGLVESVCCWYGALDSGQDVFTHFMQNLSGCDVDVCFYRVYDGNVL